MIAFILFMKFQRHQLHWNKFLDQSTSRDVSSGNNGIHLSYMHLLCVGLFDQMFWLLLKSISKQLWM